MPVGGQRGLAEKRPWVTAEMARITNLLPAPRQVRPLHVQMEEGTGQAAPPLK